MTGLPGRPSGGGPLRLGSLCSGYGGLDMGVGLVLPVEHAWHAELDPAASTVLAAHWPQVPNLGDITAVDWAAVEPVDVLTAGFPCQDVSTAGKRAGIAPGTRSGLWSHVARAIDALRPSTVILENVRGLLSARAHSDLEPCPWCVGDDPAEPVLRALGAVLGTLADLGYDAAWQGVPAAAVGAPHLRWRVFIHAWPTADPVRQQPVPVAGGGGGHAAGVPGELTLLPTPAARLGDSRGTPDVPTAHRRMYDEGRRNLDDAVALLPTPAARDWKTGTSNIMDRNARPLNEVVVNLLPTPTVVDARGGRNATANRVDPKPTTTTTSWTLSELAHADRWGDYAPAIARWEAVTGRAAPEPTELGTKGQPRLSPTFVEWLMGLPAGWVTDHLKRSDALRVLGNGVVPQQAAYAIAELLAVDVSGVAA